MPGIPLAIVLPAVSFLLVERDRAKARFLSWCAKALELTNVRVESRDAREVGALPNFELADVVVSRAAAPPEQVLRRLGRLLKPDGEALLLVGHSLELTDQLGRAAGRRRLELLRDGTCVLRCGPRSV